MNKTIITAVLLASLLMTGCGRILSPNFGKEPEPMTETTSEPPDDRKSDEEFVAAVGRALQARWDISSAYTAEELAAMSAAEYQSYLRSCVFAEEDALGSILDYRLLDADLAALAQRYYYALDLQREGASYARTRSVGEYNSTWVLGYYNRVSVVYDLLQQFSLSVDAEYLDRLQELTAAWLDAKKQVAFQELTAQLPQTLRYEEDVDASDGMRTCYVGEVVNTTEYDIRNMAINVSFLDAGGKILFQTSDWIADLHAGQSARSVIWADVRDYVGMQYSISIYQ